MQRDVFALFVHGIGVQEKDFAAQAQARLGNALALRGQRLHSQVVHWAPLLDKPERRLLADMQKRGAKGNPMQRLAVSTLADALAYRADRPVGKEIHALVDWQYSRLRAGGVHIFAHSLGGLIMCDWLRSRANARPARLHTFGCNLPLFSLGTAFDCPRAVMNDGTWTNYFDSADMLGYPLHGVMSELGHVRDVRVDVGGWFTGWTGFSHLAYWTDRRFWSKTVPAEI